MVLTTEECSELLLPFSTTWWRKRGEAEDRHSRFVREFLDSPINDLHNSVMLYDAQEGRRMLQKKSTLQEKKVSTKSPLHSSKLFKDHQLTIEMTRGREERRTLLKSRPQIPRLTQSSIKSTLVLNETCSLQYTPRQRYIAINPPANE